MTIDPSRYESPSCQRGRRRSITPGRAAAVPWGTSTNFESVMRSTGRRHSGTPVRGRYTTPMRAMPAMDETISNTPWGIDNVGAHTSTSRSTGRKRQSSIKRTGTPHRAGAPMWFAHTSDSLLHDPRPDIPVLTTLEKQNKDRNPMQSKILPDMGISRKKDTQLHLKGSEQTWFKSTPSSGFAEEASRALEEAQRKKALQTVNEHQYQLHKAHDDVKKRNQDSCDDRYRKGKAPVSGRKLQEADHQFGAFWFGGLDEKEPSPAPVARQYNQQIERVVPQTSFPQSSLSLSTSYQHNDKIVHGKQHKRQYPHQAYKTDVTSTSVQVSKTPSKPAAPPFGVDSFQPRTAFAPRNVNTTVGNVPPAAFDKSVHKQQLNEALSSYRKYVKV